MEFGNPIVGSEDLIRESIKSPNFTTDPETGVEGWRIARDGSATFYNLTVGSENFTIDENGNAVFNTVSADVIYINGELLSDYLTRIPVGTIASTRLPNDTTQYAGTEVLCAEIIIPSFDVGRRYQLGFYGRFDPGTSTPTYIQLYVYYAWDTPATTNDTLLRYSIQAHETDTTGDITIDFASPFQLSSAGGTDMHIGVFFIASENGTKYYGTPQARIWVEDIGTALNEGTWTPTVPAKQQYTKTYSCIDSSSFQSDGDNRGVAECYQGYYSSTNGNQFSLIAFDYSQIQNDLSGSTIDKVELYLNNNHFYLNNGGEALIGTHNESSVSGDHPSSDVLDDRISTPFFAKGEAKWVTIPNSIGEALRNGTRKGIALGPASSNSNNDYGYFAGNGQSGEPRLRITYTK